MEKLSDVNNSNYPHLSQDTSENVFQSMNEQQQTNIQHQPDSQIDNSMYSSSDADIIDPLHQEKEGDKPDQSDTNPDKAYILSTLHLINEIVQEAEVLRSAIEEFAGSSTDDKEYRYLEEMLIRGTVKLDNIDIRENHFIRQERKRGIQYIQKLMRLLDARLKENVRKIEIFKEKISEDGSGSVEGKDDYRI